MDKKLTLFLTAFLQVGLVCMNVVFISKNYIFLMMLTSFGISFTWSFNIKKVAFGNNADRLVYSIGAFSGNLLGYFFSHYLITIL